MINMGYFSFASWDNPQVPNRLPSPPTKQANMAKLGIEMVIMVGQPIVHGDLSNEHGGMESMNLMETNGR